VNMVAVIVTVQTIRLEFEAVEQCRDLSWARVGTHVAGFNSGSIENFCEDRISAELVQQSPEFNVGPCDESCCC